MKQFLKKINFNESKKINQKIIKKIKTIDIADKIFSISFMLLMFLFIFNISSLVHQVNITKKVISLQTASSINANILSDYKSEIKDMGIKEINPKNITLLEHSNDEYTFEVKADNEKIFIVEVVMDKDEEIKKIDVYNTNNLQKLETIKKYMPENVSHWQIENWVVNTPQEIVFSQDALNQNININNLISASSESTEVAIVNGENLISNNTTSSIIFSFDDTTYSISSKEMSIDYKLNSDIYGIIETWKDNSQEFFASMESTATNSIDYSFTYAKIGEQKYPMAVGTIINQNHDMIQENIISLIFIPEKEIEIIIIGNNTQYIIAEESTDTSQTEISEDFSTVEPTNTLSILTDVASEKPTILDNFINFSKKINISLKK